MDYTYPNQLQEKLLIRSSAQEEEQHHYHRQYDTDCAKRVEKLRCDHEGCKWKIRRKNVKHGGASSFVGVINFSRHLKPS